MVAYAADRAVGSLTTAAQPSRWKRNMKRIHFVLIALIAMLGIAACGGSHHGGTTKTITSNWDQMQWDQDNWQDE